MVTAVNDIDAHIRQRLREGAYRGSFRNVSWQFHDGHLKLQGRVPSFYLKQVLQVQLRDLDQIDCIDNQVEVDV